MKREDALEATALTLPKSVKTDIRLEQAEVDAFTCPSCGGTLDLIGWKQVCSECEFSEEIEVSDYRDDYPNG